MSGDTISLKLWRVLNMCLITLPLINGDDSLVYDHYLDVTLAVLQLKQFTIVGQGFSIKEASTHLI